MTWLNTVQRDLRAYNLTLNQAVDLAQNRPLWRLMSTYGTTHSQWCMPEKNKKPTVQAGGRLQRLHSADDVATEWLKTWLVNALNINNSHPWAKLQNSTKSSYLMKRFSHHENLFLHKHHIPPNTFCELCLMTHLSTCLKS